MHEIEPTLVIDTGASAEQLAALKQFEAVVKGFTEEELLGAMHHVQQTKTPDVVLPLTKRPAETKELFTSWRAVLDTEAYLVAEFNTELEDQIENDERFQDLIARRQLMNAEEARLGLIRLRFAIFGGALAVREASLDQEPEALRAPA